MSDDKVRVPSEAVSGDDISSPTTELLRRLSLLPTTAELQEAGRPRSAFSGPPDSVALIEAGATAANKWWAAGLGGAVAVTWAAVVPWWKGAGAGTQHVVLWVAAIVTAAALLSIAHLLGSDVRGRAAVATETVRARASVAEAFVRAAQLAHVGTPGEGAVGHAVRGRLQLISLPPLTVEYIAKPGADEAGWMALALVTDGYQQIRYLVAKGVSQEWVDSDKIKIS
jgi:hypothetical protein